MTREQKALLVVLLHSRPSREDLEGDQSFWSADTLQPGQALQHGEKRRGRG